MKARHTDQVIAEAIRTHGMVKASEVLGYSHWHMRALRARLARNGLLERKARRSQKTFSDDELLSALNAGGTEAAAARLLGVTRQCVNDRLKRSRIMKIWVKVEKSHPKG